jgi:hypothetical protein
VFKKIMAVYAENHMDTINTLYVRTAELVTDTTGGTNIYLWETRGKIRGGRKPVVTHFP